MNETKRGVLAAKSNLTTEEFMKACLADGLAIQHRFKAEPSLKYGKPFYQHANTVEAIAHAQRKAPR